MRTRPELHALAAGALALAALLAGGAAAHSQTEPDNLLPNGGFDAGTTGWMTPSGATLEADDGPDRAGNPAGTVTSGAAGSIVLLTQYWLAPTMAGAEHTLRAEFHAVAAVAADPATSTVRSVELGLEFYSETQGGLVGIPATSELTDPPASWRTIEVGPETAPSDATHVRVRVIVAVAGPGAVLYMDSFVLEAGEPPAGRPPAGEPPGPTPAVEAAPAVFASLTNGDFELPGPSPWGWRTHAGTAAVASEGGSRLIVLTSNGTTTAWLHQAFAVEGGRWYEASGRLRAAANTSLARIRVAWYESEDASGTQLSTVDSAELSGSSGDFSSVSTGKARAPDPARSAELRVMLRPSGTTPAILHADDVSFARTAPPPVPVATSVPVALPTPEPVPAAFASLTNGDFELPGDAPYGWRTHGADAAISPEGGSRAVLLTSRGGSTAWLHQAFAVEGGRWYEATARLRPGENAARTRLRVAWYASDDASGTQISTADSEELDGAAGDFAGVSTGRIRAPAEARSVRLRLMLRPAGEAPATLLADDVSFARVAPPPPPAAATAEAAHGADGAPARAPEAPAVFAALTNGDFELPGDAPYGWRAHAGVALVTSRGGSRAALLTSGGSSTAWLHQAFAVEGGRWYEATARLRPGANAGLTRIRVAWYASDDASGPQLSTADSEELDGAAGDFGTVSTGRIHAPDEARSARLRLMLRPAGEAPATLAADDVSFARVAPPPPPAGTTGESETPPEATPPPPAIEEPVFFPSLTNGDFELPGETPYGWRARAGDALVASEGGSRVAALTSRGEATAWLHQSFAVEGGEWYTAGGRLRAGEHAALARIRVAWYASDDASGPQLSTADSQAIGSGDGAGEGFAAVSTGAIRAPAEARSAQLRIMLRPAAGTPAVLLADDLHFAPAAAPAPPAPSSIEPAAGTPAPQATPPQTAPEAAASTALEPYGARSAAATPLRITELMPDPAASGPDAEYEWIEVANVGASSASLAGLFLADNHGRIGLPAITLPPGGVIVVAGPLAATGDAVAIRHEGGLFNGLGNAGDRLALARGDGAILDALSYGSDDSVDAPPLRAPAAGRSLQRSFDSAGRLSAATVAEHPTPGRLEADAGGGDAARANPAAGGAAAGETGAGGEGGPRMAPSSIESLRRQLDETADWNRTAWIALVAVAAIALAAAAAHRARELLRAPPPARRRTAPRRERRWRRYASGLRVRRRRTTGR